MAKKTGVNTSSRENPVVVGFGDRVKAARKQAGMTQVQLAKAVGVDESGLNAWERGGRLPEKAISLVRLSEALGVSVDYLLTGRTVPGVEGLITGLEDLVSEAKRIRLGGDTSGLPISRVAPPHEPDEIHKPNQKGA